MTYTTTDNVSNELGGFIINASSTPSSSVVSGWITKTEALIDERTGMSWNVNTVTEEIYDYDGSGLLRLNHAPIISITTLEKEVNGLNATSESWVELSEGRTSSYDFIVYSDEGEIEFHGTKTPKSGIQNIKVSYTWGSSSVPSQITRLATLMVAKRVTDSVMNNSATNEGGSLSVGTISISDPSKFGENHRNQMSNEINELFKTIGQFKTYRLNRNYRY